MIDTENVRHLRRIEKAKRKRSAYKKALAAMTTLLLGLGFAVFTVSNIFVIVFAAIAGFVLLATTVWWAVEESDRLEAVHEAREKYEDYLNAMSNEQERRDNPTEADVTAQELKDKVRLLDQSVKDLTNRVRKFEIHYDTRGERFGAW